MVRGINCFTYHQHNLSFTSSHLMRKQAMVLAIRIQNGKVL